ncbi:MAG: hypothetical protein K6B75_01800 [Lachnospiraceae bacterium]|nr:hypothetical protein [Lachnospiraceae bacterium]
MDADEKREKKEKMPLGEYECSEIDKSARMATLAALLACTVIFLLRLFVKKEVDFGIYAVVFLMAGIVDVYQGKKFRGKRSVIAGVVKLIVAGVFFLLFAGTLFI